MNYKYKIGDILKFNQCDYAIDHNCVGRAMRVTEYTYVSGEFVYGGEFIDSGASTFIKYDEILREIKKPEYFNEMENMSKMKRRRFDLKSAFK